MSRLRPALLIVSAFAMPAALGGPGWAHKPDIASPIATGVSVSGSAAWIQVASPNENLANPLVRRFIVGVFRASDGGPVRDARVEILSDMQTMPSAHNVPALLLTARGNPGTYAGDVQLPMAGPWAFRIKVSGPVTGVVDFVDRVGEASARLFAPPTESRFRFENAVNLSGRALHLLGAAVWIGGLAMLSVLSVRANAFKGLAAPSRLLGIWQAGGLGLLFLTGVYNLFVNTPPGRLVTPDDLQEMIGRPYGPAYVGLLLFKLGCFLLLVGIGIWGFFRRENLPALTWVRMNVALGLLILMVGGALSYLHILVHGHNPLF